MSLIIETFVLGPLENNTFLLYDESSLDAAVVDPSFGSQALLPLIQRRGLSLRALWITHAHFDHFAGVNEILAGCTHTVKIGLHPQDFPHWQTKGMAADFGIQLPDLPDPSLPFFDGQTLDLGDSQILVRHTPGHSPGHVILISTADQVAFVGDLIFRMSVGRTDLVGGNTDQLMASIRNQIFTLPDDTRLLNGHGPETSVGYEKKRNPFFR